VPVGQPRDTESLRLVPECYQTVRRATSRQLQTFHYATNSEIEYSGQPLDGLCRRGDRGVAAQEVPRECSGCRDGGDRFHLLREWIEAHPPGGN